MDIGGLKLVQAPSGEPVSLQEVRDWLRLTPDQTEFDPLLQSLIPAARGLLEVKTARQFLQATWRLSLPGFPGDGLSEPVRLPWPPLISVGAVEYVATDGTLTTLATTLYEVDVDAEPAEIWPAYAAYWPLTRPGPRAVRVTYTAGYGLAADVPQGVKTAIKMTVAHWFEHPEAVMPGSFDELPLAVQSLALSAWTGEYQ